ncbi:hypothetical protein ACR9GP_24645 [Enterobacter ludwigii]
MVFEFDKSRPTIHELWVDSISGYSTSVFSVNGKLARGSIGVLAQGFHPQELNHGPYLLLQLQLSPSQVDEMIEKLLILKAELS